MLFINFNICYACNNLNNINILGIEKIPFSKILNAISKNIQSNKDVFKSDNIIHNLFNTGYFNNIQIKNFDNKTYIYLKEKNIISNVLFKGNITISNDVIKQCLSSLNIKKNEYFDKYYFFLFNKKIKKKYFIKGKYGAHCNLSITHLPNNYVQLNINIVEGVNSILNKIKIVGNKKYSKNMLLNMFNKKHNVFLWNLRNKNYYYPYELSKSLKKLQELYFKNGFINFKINYISVIFSKNSMKSNIYVNIHEGNQYKIKKINVFSNTKNLKKLIKKIFRNYNNNLYNINFIKDIENKIKEFLSNYGYLEPEINIYPIINHNKNTVELSCYINKGYSFIVNNIYITGNINTEDNVIRREIKQLENKIINIMFVKQSEENIKNSGYFSSVNTQIVHTKNTLNKVDIIYTVKEKNNNEINVGLKYKKKTGVNFNISLNQNNFLGTGNIFSFEGNKNLQNNSFSTSFIYFPKYSKKYNFSNMFYFKNVKRDEYDDLNYKKIIYGMKNNIYINKKENKSINLGLDYNNNVIKKIEDNSYIVHDINSKKTFNGNSKHFNIFVKDLFMNYFFSIKHHNNFYNYNNIYISGKITFPFSNNFFYKTEIESNKELLLNNKKNILLRMKNKIGYGNTLDYKDYPFYENFNLLYADKIRGFDPYSIGIKKYYKHNRSFYKKHLEYFSGGNAEIFNNVELVIPHYININDKKIRFQTIFFVDAGGLWNSNFKELNKIHKLSCILNKHSFFPKKINISSGVNFKWISPIGPLSLALSIPLKCNNGDVIEFLQFNFG